jgi:hypothetical protein
MYATGRADASPWSLRRFRELLLQHANLLEAFRNVAHDRRQPDQFDLVKPAI